MQIKALFAFLASYGIVASQATDLYRNLRSEDASTTPVPSKVAPDDFEWVALDSFSASMSMSMLNAGSDSLAFVGPSDNSGTAASAEAAKSSVGSGKAAKTGSTKSSKSSSKPSSQPSEIPSSKPSSQPSEIPSSKPSSQPSEIPSSKPSSQPSEIPSSKPSSQPSEIPSSKPSSQPSDFCDNPNAIAFDTPCPTGSPSICCQENPAGTPSPVPIVCRPPTGTGGGPQRCLNCIQPCPTSPTSSGGCPSPGPTPNAYRCDQSEDCCAEGAVCRLTGSASGNNRRCCKESCIGSPSSCPTSNVPTQYSCNSDSQCCEQKCSNGRCRPD